MTDAAKLPPCPLCGRSPCGIYGELWCPDREDNDCPMSRVAFTSEQWRCLAAPRVPKEVEALARFGARLLDVFTDHWNYCDIDGADVNDVALETGVIVQRTEKHPAGECEACDEFDAPCCEVPPEVLQTIMAFDNEPDPKRPGAKRR